VIEMPTATIVLWNHEPIYESPARKTFSVNWEGNLVRADISIDVDPNWAVSFGARNYVQKIVINGTEVSFIGDPNDVMSIDARPYLRRGSNIIEIYHNFVSIWGIQTAGCYAYITVESSGSVGGEIVQPPSGGGGFDINMFLMLLVVFVVLMVILIAFR